VNRFSLSGADAVHLAAASGMLRHGEVTFVTWDRRQSQAAHALGFSVQPPID
jgi:predicted nucleic acid-binding protein